MARRVHRGRLAALAGLKNFDFLYVFNVGGTMTESANYDSAPSESDVFKNGGGWLPSGRGVLTERITISADGQTFTSTLRCEMFGQLGEPVEGSGNAKGQGERIRF